MAIIEEKVGEERPMDMTGCGGGVKITDVKIKDNVLVIEVVCPTRVELMDYGRTVVSQFIRNSKEYNSWAGLGVDSVTGPMVYDPKDSKADPRDTKKGDEPKVWQHRQIFQITRMPM